MNYHTTSLYKKIIFLIPLCITTHILAMEPERNIAPFNWRSQCVPVKSSQIVPSTYSEALSYKQIQLKDTLANTEISYIDIRYIELLLKNGADQTIKDHQGYTPVCWFYKHSNGRTKSIFSEDRKHFLNIHNVLLYNRLEKLIKQKSD